jgi:hydrogenase/urease accessory protein HupE
MNDFTLYLEWGWDHIISKDALDHLLFMLALSINFSLKEWRELLWMITAFTIGHSLTLALSVLDVFRLPSEWVELMIPITIAITASGNIWWKKLSPFKKNLQYYIILFFGLIHGMGFANAIRFTLSEGQSLGWGLFGFNIGLECGQIFVVLSFLSISSALLRWTPLKKEKAIWGVSLVVLIISVLMVLNRLSK